VYGTNLFVADSFNGRIDEYTTSGATVNASLITGLTGDNLYGPQDIAVSGSNLFVTNYNFVSNGDIGAINEYTTSGATVKAPLVLSSTLGLRAIAVFGSDLFVTNWANGTIGEYTTSGETVNESLITVNDSSGGIVVVPVPEPSTALLLSESREDNVGSGPLRPSAHAEAKTRDRSCAFAQFA